MEQHLHYLLETLYPHMTAWRRWRRGPVLQREGQRRLASRHPSLNEIEPMLSEPAECLYSQHWKELLGGKRLRERMRWDGSDMAIQGMTRRKIMRTKHTATRKIWVKAGDTAEEGEQARGLELMSGWKNRFYRLNQCLRGA